MHWYLALSFSGIDLLNHWPTTVDYFHCLSFLSSPCRNDFANGFVATSPIGCQAICDGVIGCIVLGSQTSGNCYPKSALTASPLARGFVTTYVITSGGNACGTCWTSLRVVR